MQVVLDTIIQWGDCDEQGIVFYPPLVKATATFAAPASYDQRLAVEAEITRWGGSSFEVAYTGPSDGVTIFDGNEVRVWLVPGHDKAHAAAVPEEFRSALSGPPRHAATPVV
jgi:4-hydroxybenzoyl-CoA thioesterase